MCFSGRRVIRRFEAENMKRNMDLIQLMIDAGLVEGITRRDQDGKYTGAVVSRLTWAGHDFLQSVRNDALWNKAKNQVMKSGASWTFDILKEWAKHELKQKLGLP